MTYASALSCQLDRLNCQLSNRQVPNCLNALNPYVVGPVNRNCCGAEMPHTHAQPVKSRPINLHHKSLATLSAPRYVNMLQHLTFLHLLYQNLSLQPDIVAEADVRGDDTWRYYVMIHIGMN